MLNKAAQSLKNHSESLQQDLDEIEDKLRKLYNFNSVIIAAEIYVKFPYQVQGYYKCKYTEEYRQREGKSQIEWYGEKYFNKHILGTSKEDKTGNSDLANGADNKL